MNIPSVYLELWELAKPYYLKGRPMDFDHIEWMMRDAWQVCQTEGLDDSLLMPLCILHDVGYSQVPSVESADYYQLDIRRLHMDKGAEIAEKILHQINYSPEKIAQIKYYISVHDNWAYDEVDIYLNDPVLGTFKDLDYIWIYTAKGFEAMKEIKKFDDAQMLAYLEAEPSPIFGKKPFSNQTTEQLHKRYLLERREAINKH